MRARAPLRAGAGGLRKAISGAWSGSTAKRHAIDIALALADHDVDGLAELDLPLDRLAFAAAPAARRGVGLDDRRRRLAGRVDADHGEVVGAAGAHGDDAADRHRIFGARRPARPRR